VKLYHRRSLTLGGTLDRMLVISGSGRIAALLNSLLCVDANATVAALRSTDSTRLQRHKRVVVTRVNCDAMRV
jgi:hypothetical protein